MTKAKEILQSVAERYSAIKSYQDTGVVIVDWPELALPHETLFSTNFLRPSFFRREWSKPHPYPPLYHIVKHSAVWCDGERSYSWSSRDGKIEAERNLSSATCSLPAVAAISLLSKKFGIYPVTQMTHVFVCRDEMFEGVECFRLAGNFRNCGPCEIWIGKEDLLIRKHCTSFCPPCYDQEIYRNIKIDEPIPIEEFQFTPPSVGYGSGLGQSARDGA